MFPLSPLPPLFLSTLYLFISPPSLSLPAVLACKTGEAPSGRPGVGRREHDQDYRVWSLWVGHLVPLSVPRGIRPPGEALHVRILLEVYEEPDYSTKAHGKADFLLHLQLLTRSYNKMTKWMLKSVLMVEVNFCPERSVWLCVNNSFWNQTMRFSKT